MSTYERPPVDAPVFRGADGRIIDYGRRWGGPPPEDTYSVETHPERFAPLHDVADALIAHLRRAYEVEVDEGDEAVRDLQRPPFAGAVRAVRIRPNDPACASLTFVFTAYPGIHVHAGLLHDFHYPVCGCDACDSTWDAEADDLEKQVQAVVSGNYREHIERGLSPWVEHRFTYADGEWRGGRSRARDMPADQVRAAKPILRTSPTAGRPGLTPPRARARARTRTRTRTDRSRPTVSDQNGGGSPSGRGGCQVAGSVGTNLTCAAGRSR